MLTLEVPTSYPGVQLVSAGDGPCVIINSDPNNTLTLGGDNTVSIEDLTNTVPLLAGQSLAVNGEGDIWAIANGATITVYIIPGGVSSFPNISNTGPEFITDKTGWFIYDSPSKFGHLVAYGVPPSTTTDPVGNPVSSGSITIQNEPGTIFIGIQSGQLLLAKVSGGALAPNIELIDNSLSVNNVTLINPTKIQTSQLITTWPNHSQNPEGPHGLPAMSNGWTIGTLARYEYNASNYLEFSFINLTPGTKTDGTLLWAVGTLATPYVVPSPVIWPVTVTGINPADTTKSPYIQFNTDGSIACYGINNVSVTRIDAHGIIPLASGF